MFEPISHEELLKLRFKKLVKRDGKGNIDFYHEGVKRWTYWIEEKEVETRRGLIRWIRHLSEKNWITTRHIVELIDVSHEIANKKPF